jgi:hypothetical protein
VTHGRGGDRQSETRCRRDVAIIALGRMLAPGASARRQAEEVVSRLARYQPAPNEQSAERLLMAEVVATGLSLPSADRVRKIIGLPKKPVWITHGPPQLRGDDTVRLPMGLEFCGELDLKMGDRIVSLSPAEAFGMAQDLIRRATKQIVIEEADGARALLDAVQPASGGRAGSRVNTP